jgi:hypothetical protein
LQINLNNSVGSSAVAVLENMSFQFGFNTTVDAKEVVYHVY